jgi:cytochrome c-type biogenesis protein
MTGSDIGYLAAFGGGIVSFLSPCVLPIVPACISVVTGIDITETSADRAGRSRHLVRVARDTSLFVAGFGVVFVLLDLTATTVGRDLFRDKLLLLRVSGAVVVAMGLLLGAAQVVRSPLIQREVRFHPRVSRLGPFAAPVAGAAFGFGWTPCLGPVLASILAVATTSGSVGHSVMLLVLYSLGLGVPFLAVGLLFGQLTGALGWMRRHARAISVSSAAVMVAFGVLLFVDRLSWVTSELEAGMRAVGLGRLINLG